MMTIFHDGQLPDEKDDKQGFDLEEMLFYAILFFMFTMGLSIVVTLL